jgi:hypothetical protein
MAKKSAKVTQSSSRSSVSSASQRVTSAVQKKAKAMFKRVKPTASTHSGSSTVLRDLHDSEDEAANEKAPESIRSDDSSIVEIADVDPAGDLGECCNNI